MRKSNLFPALIRLSESRLGWLEEDIDAWLNKHSSLRGKTRMTMHSITAAEFVRLEVPPRRYIFDPFLPERGLAEFMRSLVSERQHLL